MLDELMLRKDLTQTELRIIYYLTIMRTNAETGLCFATDQNLADALSVTTRAIEKCKQSLKAKGILDWNTERLNRKNSVSLYRFLFKQVRPNSGSVLNGTPVRDKTTNIPNAYSVSPRTAVRDHTTGENAGTYYAEFGSAELDAWDRWSRVHKGKSLPRDRAGGWHVASQWPPRTQIDLEDLLAT